MPANTPRRILFHISPFASQKIIRDLPGVMDKYKIENLKDIIGGANK